MRARVSVAQKSQTETVVAAASGSADLPLSDRDTTWDADAAQQSLEPGQYDQAAFWRDPEGDPEAASSYKLWFAKDDSGLVAVWKGVVAAAGAIQGARGGVDIPEDDVAAVKARIEGYYGKARTKFGDDTIQVPWADDGPADEASLAPGHGAIGDAFVRIRPELESFESTAVTIHDLVRRAVNEGATAGWRDVFGPTAELPLELQPADTRPDGEADVQVPEATTNAAQMRWAAVLAPEGQVTDDGRLFAPGSISWRQLPLTLMAMTETPGEGGHAGAKLAGRIDRIWRDESVTPTLIRAEGIFDNSEYGNEIARLVGDETLRGNSVDLAIREAEFGPRDAYVDEYGLWKDDAPGEEAPEQDLIDVLLSGDEDLIMVARDAVIGMSTVCPFPAFENAGIVLAAGNAGSPDFAIVPDSTGFRWRVWLKDALHPDDVLTASAAGMTPEAPPAEWFADPELEELTPLTITEDGRVYGHAAPWGVCHIGIPGMCRTAPHSESDYAYFLLKEVVTDEGDAVHVGTITLGTGHAEKTLGQQQAVEHYDNTGTAVADVTAGEDEHGIWVAGALRPDLPAARVRDLRGAVLSGDWRSVEGELELVGLLAVNVPGFPVPRTAALVAAGIDDEPEVLSLVAAGIHIGEVETVDDLRDRAQLRALAARAEGGLAALAALAETGDDPLTVEFVQTHHEFIPDPAVSRAELRASLLAAAAEPIETGYELTQGGLTERRFFSEALAAGYSEIRSAEWPCEDDFAAAEYGEVLESDGIRSVIRLEDGAIVYASIHNGWARFTVAGPKPETGEGAIAAFAAAHPPLYRNVSEQTEVPITFWTLGRYGPTSRLRMIESASWDDVAGNYSADVHAELARLMDGFQPGKDGQLLVWNGPPGTGKSWALRALATAWREWAEFSYITDPDAFFVKDPSYMIDVLLADTYETLDVDGSVYSETGIDGKWRVLILEDTGELLSADAKQESGQGLSRLLNVVDGMIGQGLRVLALVTTNDELTGFHPAVIRPGRCASQIEFGSLSPDEATAWLEQHAGDGVVDPVEQPMTLAELFAEKGAPALDVPARDEDFTPEPEEASDLMAAGELDTAAA